MNGVSNIWVWGVYPLGAMVLKNFNFFIFEIMKDIRHECHGFMK